MKYRGRSEHNAVSGALVKLLHECIGSSVLTGKYCMLVMKCIWKVIYCLFWSQFFHVDFDSGDTRPTFLAWSRHGRLSTAGRSSLIPRLLSWLILEAAGFPKLWLTEYLHSPLFRRTTPQWGQSRRLYTLWWSSRARPSWDVSTGFKTHRLASWCLI